MNTNRFRLIFMIIGLLPLLFQGCTEKEDDPGTVVTRSSFLGEWVVQETKKASTYDVKITADPNSSDGVFISNFANLGYGVPAAGASVSGSTITIDPGQVIAGVGIGGSGTLSGERMTMNYTITTGADQESYFATFTRP
jgi:hypothetical protein